MFAAIVCALLAPPPLAQAVADLQVEVDRAQRVVAALHAQTTGQRPSPLHVDETTTDDPSPWALQATMGKASWRGTTAGPVGTFPVVDSGSPMAFRLVPRMDLPQPEVTVRVCRGAVCHEPAWPWRCASGGCWVDQFAGTLLGADVGRHVLTFTIAARAQDYSQQWEFTAAPAFARAVR